MKVHVTDKILKKNQLNWKVFEGNLNTNKYDRDALNEKVCSHCLLKSFKTTDIIFIEEIPNISCKSCLFHLDPITSSNVDPSQTKKKFIS